MKHFSKEICKIDVERLWNTDSLRNGYKFYFKSEFFFIGVRYENGNKSITNI